MHHSRLIGQKAESGNSPTAEFERSMIRERVKAGMARARVSGTKTGATIGRPAVAGCTAPPIVRDLP